MRIVIVVGTAVSGLFFGVVSYWNALAAAGMLS